MGDPRYSVAASRRDIQLPRLTQAVHDAKEERQPSTDLPSLDSWACPWIRLLCVRSGKPVPFRDCGDCELRNRKYLETYLNSEEV